MARIFKFQDHSFQDPGEEYTVDDVRKALAATFPDIAQATTEARTLDDGTEEITFIKRSGTKGQDEATAGSYPRPAVRGFAELMETRLRENDHKGGWADADPFCLFERLELKLAWIEAELFGSADTEMIATAAADVANYAMMIVDITGGLPQA